MINYTKKIKKLQEGIAKLQKERNDKILEMRHKGLTHEKIGDIFGMTREAIRQIVKKKSSKSNTLDKK